ncbi:MAG TPA: PhzF family phenazine biosynthesis protein, partial [bacterium]|nr:PhzF family phenazine biosynthesis protein [bacterium]
QQARFFTRSGWLTARRQEPWIQMDFPATPAAPAITPDLLLRALGCTPLQVGRSRFDYLAVLPSEDQVRALRPEMVQLKLVETRAVIVTAPASTPGYDFVSRVFAPAVGIDEDPVTGSAHCCLAPFWAERLGKRDLVGYQASARGGVVRVSLQGDRVLLGGRAITVFRADLLA